MTPTAWCTCSASFAGVAVGVRAAPERRSTSSSRRPPRGGGGSSVRLAGSWPRPASRPSATGAHGGRAVVVPIVASSVPCSRANSRIDRQVAEPALARAHRHGRVALGELDRVEALGERALHVLLGDVLADADEAPARFAGAVELAAGTAAGASRPATDPTASTFGGRSVGHEDPAARRRTRSARRPGRAASTPAGAPPEATSRSHSSSRPSTTTLRQPAAAPARREPARRLPRGGRRRATTLDAGALAAGRRPRARGRRRTRSRPRSPGLSAHSSTSRRTPPGSITPTRSLPGKTSGCSSAPVATTIRSARKR